MKKLIISHILTFVLAAILFASFGNNPIQPRVQAQSTGTRSDFVTRLRAANNGLITAAQTLESLDHEYVANGYSGALVIGDLVGSNSGLAVADITTAEGNLTNIAAGILKNGAVTISAGTSSTLYKIR